ncbi:hypothetical protein AB0O47_32825 [Streptomyces noursei]|uniref:hypothetical protein n=1 Tax=Streptomyces noursei TaxID=1971 RepID=UPI003450C8ED
MPTHQRTTEQSTPNSTPETDVDPGPILNCRDVRERHGDPEDWDPRTCDLYLGIGGV